MIAYIDRDILLNELNEAQIEGDEYYKGLGRAKLIVCDQQTVDVQEVKHAKWIDKPLSGYSYCRCSNCHKITEVFVSRYKVATQKYCPNCGAKMDLEDK